MADLALIAAACRKDGAPDYFLRLGNTRRSQRMVGSAPSIFLGKRNERSPQD
jgi:hypothetical protein